MDLLQPFSSKFDVRTQKPYSFGGWTKLGTDRCAYIEPECGVVVPPTPFLVRVGLGLLVESDFI